MTNMMRAVVQYEFGGPDVLRIEERAIPQPVPTEVQVRVQYAGVNPVDAKVRGGASVASVMGGFPFTLGWDVAGVVSEVGVGVTRLAVGDRVFGMPRFPRQCGAYAEYITAPSRQLVKIPENLTLAQAATVPLPATTAYQALVDVAEVKPGQTVVVAGATGTVGRLAVQIAKHLGATVIATARSRSIGSLAGLDLDQVVNIKTQSIREEISDADVVLDLIGGDFSDIAIDLVRPGGLVVSIPSGDKSALVETATRAGRRLTGMIVEPDRVALEYIARSIEEGTLHLPEPTVMDFDDVQEVHRRLDAGAGKMVLSITRED